MSWLSVSRTFRASTYICPRCTRRSSAIRPRAFHAAPRLRESPSVLSVLEERGYVHQIAGDRNTLDRLVQSKRAAFYVGIDPTAPSLHLGHLLPLMVIIWLYHYGHSVVTLVGGGTARVGDPSGRLTSRAKTAHEVHETNTKSMYDQLGSLRTRVIRYGQRRRHGNGTSDESGSHLELLSDATGAEEVPPTKPAGKWELLNNATWLENLNILDFLQTIGNGVRVGTMLGRDTVRNKMDKGDGMSFSEFTYPLLQAWDWWHMYSTREMPVAVQIGGSDQYGNIIAGMDAVRSIAQSKTHGSWLDVNGKLKENALPMGLTVPLLTTSSGEKFGKSAGNAIWLDKTMTSAFDLHGFLLRSSDEDVERYLKLFTFVSIPDIETVMAEHNLDRGKRKAQHLLASEVLELVHGREEAERTRTEHQTFRSPTLAALSETAEAGGPSWDGVTSRPTLRVVLPSSLVHNTPAARILYHAGMVQTKSDGTRLMRKGGAYVAVTKPDDLGGPLQFMQIGQHDPLDMAGLIQNRLLVLRQGKWKVCVVEVIDDAEFEARGLDAPGWREWQQKARDSGAS